MIDYKIIGKKIKDTRMNKNMTQSELAKELGISIGYVSQIESGDKCFNVERLEYVSKILEKPVSYFVEGADADDEKAMREEIEFILKNNISSDRIGLVEKLLKTIAEEI